MTEEDQSPDREDTEAADMLADAVSNSDDGSQEDSGELDPRVKAKLTKANNEARNLRKRLKELEPLAQEAQELKDSQKTEMEKLTEQLQAAQAEGAAATAAQLRIDVALDKAPDGMSMAQVRKLAKRLTGSNREELEEDAEELFAEFAPKEDRRPSSQRPKESLRAVQLAAEGATPKTDMNEVMRAKARNA